MFEFSIMRKILSKILLLLVLPISVLSQENDFQTWTSISVSKKIIKKTNLIVKQGVRFRENSSIYYKLFTDIKIKRKYNKYFSFAGGYRYSSDWNKKQDLENKNRFLQMFIIKISIINAICLVSEQDGKPKEICSGIQCNI